ncbi:hypothetical protein [Dyadobacter bucti]|uniref:hypothetical protein n=1 Tax=Dyadobacter bucti TaxID=2572203 RepID=UPI0011086C97|nr:hypothetical protein [Dyadobacter bucti]
MLNTVVKWLLLLVAIKLLAVVLTAQFDPDPRRDIATREGLCRKFNPDAVFIGTSRTLYGIDSEIFDSLNNQKTRSYNLGLFSLSFSNSLSIANQLITNESGVKTIFIELSALDYNTILLRPGNIFQDVVFRTKTMADCSTINTTDKLNGFLQGFNTTLFQLFSIAPEMDVIKRKIRTSSDPIEGRPDLRPNGHQSVPFAIPRLNTYIEENKKSAGKMIAVGKSCAPNSFYLSNIENLIKLAEKGDKKVIFFYPNNISKGEFQILSQVGPYIPEKHLIGFPADSRFADFFNPENLFDSHHFNEKGSAMYTRFLYEESLKRSDNL